MQIVMSRTLKVTGDHVMYDRRARHDVDMEKVVEDKDSQNTKRSAKVAKELFADYVKKKKLSPERGPEKARVSTYFEIILSRSEKEIIRSFKQLLDSVFVIYRIIEVSARVINLSLGLRLITPTSTLIILDITKTSSNNCL